MLCVKLSYSQTHKNGLKTRMNAFNVHSTQNLSSFAVRNVHAGLIDTLLHTSAQFMTENRTAVLNTACMLSPMQRKIHSSALFKNNCVTLIYCRTSWYSSPKMCFCSATTNTCIMFLFSVAADYY